MEGIEQIVSLAMNSGMAIVITVYFLIRDWKFQTSMQEMLGEFRATLSEIKDMVRAFHE